MTTGLWIANLTGLAAIGWIVWYFWLHKQQGTSAAVVGGVQEIDIEVKGGYTPDTVTVRAGVPVRLNFIRRESSLCSETVVFDRIGRSAKLPQGVNVPIEFTPDAPGEIPFQCQMGMLRGRVVVEKGSGSAVRAEADSSRAEPHPHAPAHGGGRCH